MDLQALATHAKTLLAFCLALCLALPAVAKLSAPESAEFRSTRTLPQSKEQVLDMVYEILHETVGMDTLDRSSGTLESKFYFHKTGPSRFRTKVTAVVTPRADGTVVQLKAQRELLMEALNPGIYQAGPRWQQVGTHQEISDDLIERVEKAAGVWIDPEEEAMREAAADALAAAGGVPSTGVPVPSDSWQEIERLKTQRRDLLAPIQALDEKALEIVYSGALEGQQAQLQQIKSERNRLWEETRPRIMEIDKRILQLVLAD